jgi:hypothetical protein
LVTRKRSYVHDDLRFQRQAFPTGGQYDHGGAAAGQRVHDRGDTVDDVLAVVEDEEETASLESHDELVQA